MVILDHFFKLGNIKAALHFFCTFTFPYSITELNNQVCVLGKINALYEEHCDIHMYVCMCLKVSVNYGQPVRVFFLYFIKEWVNMVLRIINLEGQQNCMIDSKVPMFFLKFKNLKHKHVGCLSRGNRLEYCGAHSDTNFDDDICNWIPKTL